MEELSIAEKAMRYDVAVNKAKSKITGDKDHILYEDDVIEMFPELKESEDERVRKELLKHLKEGADGYEPAGNSEDYKRWLGWLEKRGETFTKQDVDDAYLKGICDAEHELEKQGEQKKSVVVIPKFRVGDVIRPKGSTAEYTIESISGECYHGKGWGLHISCDDDYELVKQKPAWSEEDEKTIDEAVECLENYVEYVQGGFSQQHVLDLASRVESLKDRVGCEANCTTTNEWSEEDENHVKSILSTIECCKAQFPNAQSVAEAYNADIEWFISLKDRYTWKPSELPHWKKSTLQNDNTTGFNSDYFCHNGYCINYKELFEKLPKDD